jgi:hypothetical protein
MVTLLYGQPGTRKTSYAGSSPNPILFDFDNGVRRVDEDYRCPFVPSEYLRNWEDVESQLSDEQFKEFETFIFDSVTKLLDYMSDFVMRKDVKNKAKGGGLSLQGYGSLGTVFKAFLSKLEVMGKNIVFVAHDKESKEGDSTRLRPDMVGASLGFVTRSADMIGYVEMVNNDSVVQFSPTDRFYAKNSCGIEPQFLTSKYTLAQVIDKYKTGVNAKSAENKIYKNAMKEGLALLGSVTNAESLNTSYESLKKIEQAMSSKVELWGAFKEIAETVGCFFNSETKLFEEFDKVEIEIEDPVIETETESKKEKVSKPKTTKDAND